ncbi:MAG: acyl-CoA dehydrogenase family protein [Gammaproteobacteria bacterium]|nr:acyl-CoA dehydrogenase family protein [Gammaproteobacteria bacterium]MDH3433576.1 acyl-CoA dehydrogenase family protein [Gammaproteobacteria bacterium]
MSADTTAASQGDKQADNSDNRDKSPAKALFRGEIVRSALWPFPGVEPDQKEMLDMVVDSVDRFLTDAQDDFGEWDRIGEQPKDFVDALRELGLFGLIIPEEYGGIGLSNAGYSRVLQQTSRYDSSASLTIGAHSSIGMKGLLLFGTDAQKKQYLPRLASGELIAAYCLTEPGAGSDAASIQTKAVRDSDGDWILNGEKTWITNGGIADFFTVFARTDGEGGKISAFMVEREFPGVSVGQKESKLGIRASSTTSVSFSDVKVPAQNLLGDEGKGFKIAMSILNNGRTGLGGGAVGGMKTCIALATKQALERKQFGQSIAEFGMVKKKISEMTVDCFAAESAVWMVAHYIDSGYSDYSIEAAISKVFASEAMIRCANEALQIAAGSGYMKELPYERIFRDSRILTIFEGTSEILRLFIALSGIRDAGQLLQELGSAVEDIFNNPIKGFGLLSDYAGRRITNITSIGQERIVGVVGDELRDDALIFEKYALELARMTDVLLRRHGKSIIDKQFALQRAADVVIDLFVGLCVLSRVSSMSADDSEQYAQAVSIAHLFSHQAKRRMNRNLRAMLHNEDEIAKSLAEYIYEVEGYPWDTLN